MKAPPANTSPEATALRRWAQAFTNNLKTPVSDDQDTRGQRLNANLLRAARRYSAVAERAEKGDAFRAAERAREENPVVLRIQGTHDEKGTSWIERYFLRDKAGRYRERRDIPGNGQYAPGDNEIIRWFKSMGVTHVEVAANWNSDIKSETYPLAKFARILYRLSKESE